ncbi:MAG TPA: MCP four helix bundle domain-containing protein, partial [Clostridia bacterium]|nr:MCP four helix bundle domain-containing protein [Clostridia bacterium]
MNRLSVGTRTLLGFGFVCLLFEGISWFAIQKSLALKNDSDSLMANSLPGLIAAGEIETGLAESQIQMQRLLQAQTPAQKQILLDELNQTSKMVNDAVLTYADTIWAKADRLNFEKLKRHHSEYVHQHTEFLALVETNRTKAESLLDGPLCQSYAECLKAAKALVAYKADAADEVGKTLVADTDSLTHVLPVISGLAILVVVAIGIMSVRGLTTVLTRVARSLDEGANQVTSTAGQVSSSSEKLAEG